jgi:hypothetical protein
MNHDELAAHQRRMVTLALAASVLLLAGSLLGVGEALAYLAPGAGLFMLLALGVYPGADAYERALKRQNVRTPRPRASRPRLRVGVALPRGGALLATGLAGRAPPTPLR